MSPELHEHSVAYRLKTGSAEVARSVMAVTNPDGAYIYEQWTGLNGNVVTKNKKHKIGGYIMYDVHAPGITLRYTAVRATTVLEQPAQHESHGRFTLNVFQNSQYLPDRIQNDLKDPGRLTMAYAEQHWQYFDGKMADEKCEMLAHQARLGLSNIDVLLILFGIPKVGVPLANPGSTADHLKKWSGLQVTGVMSTNGKRYLDHVEQCEHLKTFSQKTIDTMMPIAYNVLFTNGGFGFLGQWSSASQEDRWLPAVPKRSSKDAAHGSIVVSVMAMEILNTFFRTVGDGDELMTLMISGRGVLVTKPPYAEASAIFHAIDEAAIAFEGDPHNCIGYYTGDGKLEGGVLVPDLKPCPHNFVGTAKNSCEMDHRRGKSKAPMDKAITVENMAEYGFDGTTRKKLSQGKQEVQLKYASYARTYPELWSTIEQGIEQRCHSCHQKEGTQNWLGLPDDWAD
jgi:hypothetical protein